MGLPIAAVSMYPFVIPRLRPPQLVDRALNAMPDGSAVHVAFGHQFIGALCGALSLRTSQRRLRIQTMQLPHF